MATNYDLRKDDASGGKLSPCGPTSQWMTYERDCKTDPLVASDTLKVFNFPQGCVVEQVNLELLRLEGGTLTVSVGDAGSATRFHSAVNMNTGTPPTVAVYCTNYQYTSAGYCLITMSANDADLVFFRVSAKVSMPPTVGLKG
jgi:hypothetical protein